MADGVGPLGGLRDTELDAERPAFEKAAKHVAAQVESGTLGFWRLPEGRDQVALVRAQYARSSRLPRAVTTL